MKLSKKPHIVIATPGRLVEHIQNDDNLNFNKIKFLVINFIININIYFLRF